MINKQINQGVAPGECSKKEDTKIKKTIANTEIKLKNFISLICSFIILFNFT
ncbi:hypothetical protein J6P59_05765 [bacterium]|nr:hypothetical protein [bacterium]